MSKPLFWVLDWLYSLVGNWGWAIVLLTVLIKLAFYKLSETSYRSMAKMRKFTPRFQQLRERHADDRAKLNEAMMKLYREEKVNPLGGCWPILVADPGVHRAVLGAAGKRRAAPGAVHRLAAGTCRCATPTTCCRC